jgi:excinuclease UvrABC ATPase subunit
VILEAEIRNKREEQMTKDIIVKGANEHNLKNIDVVIPRDKMVVLTGLSGSGKSSLAFDTIYAEGQRRYMESLSSYARQFLGRWKNPMWNTSKDFLRRSPSIRRPPARIPAPRLER